MPYDDPNQNGYPNGYQGGYPDGYQGGYHHGQYQNWGPPPPPPPQLSPVAIASLSCGLVSVFCGLITAIAAVITGIVALVQYRRNPYPHRWMAITGIALGGVRLLFLLVYLLFVVVMILVEM